MHPRIVGLAVASLVTDLLCLAAAGIVLLGNNAWLDQVGPQRFWSAVLLLGLFLLPPMYSIERQSVVRRIATGETPATPKRPAWSGSDRPARA